MTRPAPGYGQSRLAALLMVGAVIGMALLNWRQLTLDIDISPSLGADATEPALLATADPMPGDAVTAGAGAYPEMLARPLFRASRRPAEAVKPGIAAPESLTAQERGVNLPEDIRLVGIMKQSGRGGLALIRSGASPKGEWVEIGHVLDGWRLSRIEVGSVSFEIEGEKRTLSLFSAKGK